MHRIRLKVAKSKLTKWWDRTEIGRLLIKSVPICFDWFQKKRQVPNFRCWCYSFILFKSRSMVLVLVFEFEIFFCKTSTLFTLVDFIAIVCDCAVDFTYLFLNVHNKFISWNRFNLTYTNIHLHFVLRRCVIHNLRMSAKCMNLYLCLIIAIPQTHKLKISPHIPNGYHLSLIVLSWSFNSDQRSLITNTFFMEHFKWLVQPYKRSSWGLLFSNIHGCSSGLFTVEICLILFSFVRIFFLLNVKTYDKILHHILAHRHTRISYVINVPTKHLHYYMHIIC